MPRKIYRPLLLLLCAALVCSGRFPAAGLEADSPYTAVFEDAAGLLLKEGESRQWRFTIPAAGEYELIAEYETADDSVITPQVKLTLDGLQKVLDLPRRWSNETERTRFPMDDAGNERLPAQLQQAEKAEATLYFYNSETGALRLERKEYALRFEMLRRPVRIYRLRLIDKSKTPGYQAYLDAQDAADARGVSRRFEAELTYRKSHPEIVLSYDRTTPAIKPNTPNHIRYNIIGGSGYGEEGQWISWEVDAPESAFYHLDFIYRQNINQGLDVRRRLYVDGEVPFAEARELVFPYSENFKTMTVGDAGKPFRIYLAKGRHELKLEAVLGSVSPVLHELEQIVAELGRLYTRIILIVGETPDPYRDYDLDKHIEGLTETLTGEAGRLETLFSALAERDAPGSSTARIQEAARVLRSLAAKPRRIPVNQDMLRAQINTLSDLTANMRTQPLELDGFVLRSPGTRPAPSKAGFWETVSFRFRSFLGSFAQDYTAARQGGGGKSVDVWVSTNDLAAIGFATGRDQAQILNQIANDSFYHETGIRTKISLMDASALLQAIVSGKGPDAATFLPEQVLANLFYRGALVNLRELPEYDEIAARFYPSALTALQYEKGVFALPEVQSFYMLYYRSDILREYGLKPPETWDEFYQLLAALQKKGMQAGVSESPQIYEMFLLQNGGAVYSPGMDRTGLTEKASVEAFQAWTDLYTRHSIPLAFDALNRFRTGQLPVLVQTVSFYAQLELGAPEIHHLWEMAPVPGVSAGGAVKRSQSCTVSGAAVMEKSRKKEEALQFLEWWTRTGTQNQFAFECETRMGISARYYPANIETLAALAWSPREYEALSLQRRQLDDIPQSPAAYYLSRSLSNAFRRVVYAYENPRDVIVRYGRQVDGELHRKRAELGLEGKK